MAWCDAHSIHDATRPLVTPRRAATRRARAARCYIQFDVLVMFDVVRVAIWLIVSCAWWVREGSADQLGPTGTGTGMQPLEFRYTVHNASAARYTAATARERLLAT